MDVDLTTLEAALAPYIVLFGDSGVQYVSAALAKRLGVIDDELRRNLEKFPAFCCPANEIPPTVSLAMTGRDAEVFACTAIPFDDCKLIALSDEKQPSRPFFEYADRDTFVRMFKNVPAGSLVVDGGAIVYTNDFLCSLLEMKREEVLGSRIIGILSRQSRRDFIKACETWHMQDNGKDTGCDLVLVSNRGRMLHFVARGGWIERASRQLLWIILEDVTEKDRLVRALKEEQQKFSALFGDLPAGMIYVSPRGRIIECNAYVADLVGYPREQIMDSIFTDYVSHDQADTLNEDFRRLFTDGGEITKRECQITAKGGRPVTIEYNARAIHRKGHPVKALMMFSDVTDKKALELELLEKNAEMERTLWDMAEVKDALEARAGELNKATEDLKQLNEKLGMLSITDGLTELYNHRHFQDRLSEEIERLNRLKDGVLSLLMLDIDDFKRFNDTYGHQCGDMVLKHIAALLKGSIRSIDILARYGGEEFAVILPNATTEQAVIVAERIRQTIRSSPFSYGQAIAAKVTVSIGVGTITSGHKDKSELVKKADSAMYAAKAKWKDRVEIWEVD
ncbi:MAG: sensor domain-containing diguanylate cyclase [Desulfobacterota bacterium]|jgi:diguanylate cyclase (GGDEF)-like protein/PAS domain S-box-containing protein|nr:sensor domain-containing diguanylate cyclase [Thermodesulfobacteriota bacterium]